MHTTIRRAIITGEETQLGTRVTKAVPESRVATEPWHTYHPPLFAIGCAPSGYIVLERSAVVQNEVFMLTAATGITVAYGLARCLVSARAIPEGSDSQLIVAAATTLFPIVFGAMLDDMLVR